MTRAAPTTHAGIRGLPWWPDAVDNLRLLNDRQGRSAHQHAQAFASEYAGARAAMVFDAVASAEWRLERALKTGKNPGQRADAGPVPKPKPQEGPAVDPDWSPTAGAVDFERAARDRIAAFITARYMGHGLTDIVAEILRAEGYTCHVSPPGPDNSVDIYAGLGALGLDSPRLVVQVKSEASPVGSPVVTQPSRAVSNNADQGLLVAWGGLKKPAQDEMKRLRHNMAMWDADALIDRLFKAYPNLSEALRAELPFKQIWVLVEEAED